MSEEINSNELERTLEKFEKDEHVIRGYHRTFAERLESMLRFYRNRTVDAIADTKHLRDDVLVYMRALAMIVEQAADASTHGEKNARLRGVISMCETAIKRLKNEEFDFNRRFYWHEDIFRSDMPTRHYVERIHELEREIDEMKKGQGEGATDALTQSD